MTKAKDAAAEKASACFDRLSAEHVLTFHTPPHRQGQSVEVSYAATGDGEIIRRTHDRSDGQVTYHIAELAGDDVGGNYDPRIRGTWKVLPC